MNGLFSFLAKGGMIVWPILFCSVLGLAIILERLFVFRKINKEIPPVEKIKATSLNDLVHFPGPLGEMAREIKPVCCADRELLESILGHIINCEVSRASRYLGLLSTLASIAPLLGLLGTVTGLIKAFMVVEQAGGKVNASMLAGGIWEAMLTTAVGLSVAVPLIVAHRFLISYVRRYEETLERMAVIILKKIYTNGQEYA
ncbi:MotA/TolQ/ExbB proton channel family protein [Thermodesulfatator atlanticus]|uniref:MotA/TolQ/ExbB proton channel family protein n=1 Tax=Thermodesulfatator atlanticus TaxID=501497 RepID=UPI0003B78D0F|nr:MotA/TolQ/ExbB proton channel family protein [Thermodesulfatator atlanticus]